MIPGVLWWLAAIPLLWVVELIGLVVVPVALLFTPRNADALPRWAWWWSNDEDTINGDAQWVRRDFDVRAFWPRFRWLAWRNRAHNFSRHVVGVAPGEAVPASLWRNNGRSPSSTAGVGGIEWITMQPVHPDGALGHRLRYWQLYVVVPYTVPAWVARLPGMKGHRQRAFRLLLGWKLWNITKDRPEIAALCSTIQPIKRFDYRKGV